MVAAEYGWSDEYINNLPLVRLHQIVAAIRTRKYFESREEGQRFSWLARTLAAYVAAGYMVEGDNPALEKAGTIAYDDIEAALLGDLPEKEAENKPGSYERLHMLLAGGPKRAIQ